MLHSDNETIIFSKNEKQNAKQTANRSENMKL